MIKRIKAFFALKEENKQLKEANEIFHKQMEEFVSALAQERAKKPEVKDLLKIVLDGNLKWYDHDDLKPEDKQKYYDEAEHILRMHVFNNELNFLKANWGKRAILEAHDKNIEEVSQHIQKMSWMLLGIEQFKIRLEGISNPTKQEKTKENIHSNV